MLIASLSLSFYYEWKLGLAVTAFVPLILLLKFAEIKVFHGQDNVEQEAFSDSTKVRTQNHMFLILSSTLIVGGSRSNFQY